MLTAEIDVTSIVEETHRLDVTRHDDRPDVFQFTINRSPAVPVAETTVSVR